MRSLAPFLLALLGPGAVSSLPSEGDEAGCGPTAVDDERDVRYLGLARNGIEVFLGVHYGQDTGGEHRFKPPRPAEPPRGSVVDARSFKPACPQITGLALPPLALTNVTEISEDCLHLNIARPKGTRPGDRLPVVVWVHGGGFWIGQNREITNAPDGMILESVENGLPIIHVHIQYRLSIFGFAQSAALRAEGSENAGPRDHRLALEWVRDNIAHFGGDPSRVTMWGQSSGGLAVGLQIVAFGGGGGPAPLHQALFQSQALEPGITGNFTRDAMQAVAGFVGCNATDLQAAAAVRCLRGLPMQTLVDAVAATIHGDVAHNIGDVWLPSVDGDFLPDKPSALLRGGRFHRGITALAGWTEDDLTFFVDQKIATAADTRAFYAAYLPGVGEASLDALLALYPVGEFRAQGSLSAEFYRAARIIRDILMVCEPIWLGEQTAEKGAEMFLYHWNQTMLTAPLEAEIHPPGPLGVIHTSEFAYVYGNLSHYDTRGYPFNPTPEDRALERRGSRSFSTFVATGVPGEKATHGRRDVFHGVKPAFADGRTNIFVAGGLREGSSATGGPGANPALAAQKISERCAFINSPEFIEQLLF